MPSSGGSFPKCIKGKKGGREDEEEIEKEREKRKQREARGMKRKRKEARDVIVYSYVVDIVGNLH